MVRCTQYPACSDCQLPNEDEKLRFNYYFMDFNARVTHCFSPKTTAFINVYFGDDKLKTGTKDKGIDKTDDWGSFEDDRYDMHWGNLLVQTGLNQRFNSGMSAEFTAAYTRFFSSMKHDYRYIDRMQNQITESKSVMNTDNNINDWIFRGDFDWHPNDNNRVRFGANYVRHSFLPAALQGITRLVPHRWHHGTRHGHTVLTSSTHT